MSLENKNFSINEKKKSGSQNLLLEVLKSPECSCYSFPNIIKTTKIVNLAKIGIFTC